MVTVRDTKAGFTLLEVLIAMLVGTVGLLGTVAVQQAIMSSSKNANDAAIAMRLAQQKLDELSSRNTDTREADLAIGLSPLSTAANVAARWWPENATNQPVPEYVNAEGVCLCETSGTPKVPLAAQLGTYRWRRQWKVVDLNAPVAANPALPYVISVIVSYNNDVGNVKTTRVDLERRKAW